MENVDSDKMAHGMSGNTILRIKLDSNLLCCALCEDSTVNVDR